MGNSQSSNLNNASKRKSQNKQHRRSKVSLTSNKSANRNSTGSIRSVQIDNEKQSENLTPVITNNQFGKRPLMSIQSNQCLSIPQEDNTPIVSEKKRGKIPEDALNHLDKLPVSFNDNQNFSQFKKIKSTQRNSFTSNRAGPRERRYSSTVSASGFSSNIGDPLLFSMVGDSTITDITNVSNFSINSFLDKIGEDNNYIMDIPDGDYQSSTKVLPSIESLLTADNIFDLLTEYPNDTYDILTGIYGSTKIRNSVDFQKEAFQAAETWSLRPTDVTAKTITACCKLCGWGTIKNPRKGFQELQALANKGVWQAFYHLGQCYHYGVEQANEGYGLSGRPLSTIPIQPVDNVQAVYWYKKLIEATIDTQSIRVQFYVAEAKLRVAAINFTSATFNLNPETINESVTYLKESASSGNRKAEFSLGLLTELGIVKNLSSAKEFYIRSAKKNYTPAQIQLALILLKNNSPEGITWLNQAAKLNDPRAFYYLADCYEHGKGVQVNPGLAIQNYQTAADKHNHHISEFRLGMHYLNGKLGLKEDYIKAFHYIERSAKGGHDNAQYLLGIMYRDGKVPPTTTRSLSSEPSRYYKKQSFYWIRKAATQNLHAAIIQIAYCYEEGLGTTVNHALATEYYEKAISIGGKQLPSAQQTYACFLQKTGKHERALEMYLYASGMKSNPLNTHPSNPSIIRASKRTIANYYLDPNDKSTPYNPQLGFDILMSLASEDDADAHYWIGACYEEGVPNVVKQDDKMAYKHYLISANLGSSDSQFQVGNMLRKGSGVEKNKTEAFKWFQKSAEKNNAKALYFIGIYYHNGYDSIPRDLELALVYFKRAAEAKNVDAMYSYAKTCQEKSKEPALPSSAKENYRNESFKWFTKAARQNHLAALRELGTFYGSIGDFRASADCFMKASDLNDAMSTMIIGGYFEKGQGVTVDKERALHYYTKANQLNNSTALFALAELYEDLSDYNNACKYYRRVFEDSRISRNLNSSKIARFKLALYSLKYDPNTLIHDQMPLNNSISLESQADLLSENDAFKVLVDLANEESFSKAFNWIAQCYQDGKGVSKNPSESLRWRMKASEANDVNTIKRFA